MAYDWTGERTRRIRLLRMSGALVSLALLMGVLLLIQL